MTRFPVLARAVRHRSFIIGLVLVGAVVGLALLSLVWTPYSVTAMDIRSRLQGPSASHLLGTDHFGRDVLSMIMVGARVSLAVGLAAVGAGLAIGAALGLLAAARRGWVEEAVMRLADFSFAFPALLTAIMIAAILGPGAMNAILAIAIFNVPVFARLARGAAVAVWARDFVLASRAAGKGSVRISVEHVLPNIANVLIVQATSSFAVAILAEAALSYLGIGVQPPDPSWGRMLNEAQTVMLQVPLQAVFPGLAIAASVLGLNLLGDGLRDITDPRLIRVRA